ncbi:MAG: hypothetical protein E7604_06160 [Ruminococcaceae bacterium]|nr:hypothetical protein [Oscillospiraceae bacterium]
MITITSMTPADMDGKAYVHHQSWQETYKGLIDANYLASMTLEKCQSIARRFPDNILVAKDEDRVIGFAGYGLIGMIPCPTPERYMPYMSLPHITDRESAIG